MKPSLTIQRISALLEASPTFLMMVGVPGSGKSTFIQKLIETSDQSIIIASTDDLIEAEAKRQGTTYSEIFGKLNFKQLKAQMNDTIDQAVKSLKHVAHDQTNMSKKSRMSKLKNIPETYKKVCLNFTIDDKVLRQRLDERAKRTGKVIPEFVLKSMFNTYQPPTRDEGFHHIFEIDNS